MVFKIEPMLPEQAKYVFPEQVLARMAEVIPGDTQKVRRRLEQAYQKAHKRICESAFKAELTFGEALNPGQLQAEEKTAISFLKKAKDYVEAFKESGRIVESFAIRLIRSSRAEVGKQLYNRWMEEKKNIEALESLYKGIDRHIRGRKRGRPQQLIGLENYIYDLAELYRAVSNKKFTQREYREKGAFKPLTQGQQFAYIAFEWMCKQTVYYKMLGKKYTDSNFQSACVLVCDKRRGFPESRNITSNK